MQLNYYGFSDKPFELSPDPKFLYLFPGYQEALELVWKGITDRKGLIIVTGEVGTGKTMLIHSLMARLPAQVKTAFIFHSTYDFKEMLEKIYSELGDRPSNEGEDDFKIRILSSLSQLRERGELLAAFIDEAQKLSEKVLRGLLDLLDSEPWISETLQLVLVGQPEFEERIDTVVPGYRTRISPQRVRINALSIEESLNYIEHRLRTAGRPSSEIFSPKALSMISEYSNGIPRLINIVCDNALFAGYNESLKKIEPDTIRKIIGNLEGPEKEYKFRGKNSKRSRRFQAGNRFFIKGRLPILGGLAVGIVVFLWYGEITDYLDDLTPPALVKTFLGKKGNPVEVKKSQREAPMNTGGSALKPEEVPKPSSQRNQEEPVSFIAAPSIRRIHVTDGETLSRLALQYYGKYNESLMDLILFYNPTVKNINLILVDQKIQLPELSEASLIMEIADKNYRIHLGTFSSPEKAMALNGLPALKGKEITVQPKTISSQRKWYRVEAGTFESGQEALKVLKTLREAGLLPFF